MTRIMLYRAINDYFYSLMQPTYISAEEAVNIIQNGETGVM